MLSKEIQKKRTKLMSHIRQEFQKAPKTVVSIKTVSQEAHLLDFYGHAAAHKTLITKSNHAARLKWCKAREN